MSSAATQVDDGLVHGGGDPAPHRPPGLVMAHPVVVAALIVLVVNDHLGKDLAASHDRFHSVTGKFSDVAGLVVFPLLLVALADTGLRAADRRRPIHTRSRKLRRMVLAGSVVVTGMGFAAIQVVPAAAESYTAGLELLRWLPSGVAAGLTGSPAPAAAGVNHVMDVTDVWCLPAMAVSYRIGETWLYLAASVNSWTRIVGRRSTDG